MTAKGALRAAVAQLTVAGVPGAVRDARVLLAHVLEVSPDRLITEDPDLSQAERSAFEGAIAARMRRQPVSQITGQRLFWGQSFRVTPDVLDPRPETEVVVEAAVQQPFVKMLDLGTGSGCILLSCLASMPIATGVGVDLSPAALAVAQDNAVRLNLTMRARFLVSDWFSAVSGQFDLIVSNPPYIGVAEMAELAPEVRDWEPEMALTPGGDGLEAYRAIARGASARLLRGGRLMVEIGPTQADAVSLMFERQGLSDITVLKDLDGRDRVVCCRKA